MVRCSVTPRPEQKLAIALAPEHRGRQHAVKLPAEQSDEIDDLLADPRLDGGIADDPFLYVARPGLELRLDQRHELGGGSRQPQCGGKPRPERHEAPGDAEEVPPLPQPPPTERAAV